MDITKLEYCIKHQLCRHVNKLATSASTGSESWEWGGLGSWAYMQWK